MGKMLKPGLVHSQRRVEVEDVRKAHHSACVVCGAAPAGRRLRVVDGSGRSQQPHVLCARCGILWLDARREEYRRAIDRLAGGNEPCRDPRRPGLPGKVRPKAEPEPTLWDDPAPERALGPGGPGAPRPPCPEPIAFAVCPVRPVRPVRRLTPLAPLVPY